MWPFLKNETKYIQNSIHSNELSSFKVVTFGRPQFILWTSLPLLKIPLKLFWYCFQRHLHTLCITSDLIFGNCQIMLKTISLLKYIFFFFKTMHTHKVNSVHELTLNAIIKEQTQEVLGNGKLLASGNNLPAWSLCKVTFI